MSWHLMLSCFAFPQSSTLRPYIALRAAILLHWERPRCAREGKTRRTKFRGLSQESGACLLRSVGKVRQIRWSNSPGLFLLLLGLVCCSTRLLPFPLAFFLAFFLSFSPCFFPSRLLSFPLTFFLTLSPSFFPSRPRLCTCCTVSVDNKALLENSGLCVSVLFVRIQPRLHANIFLCKPFVR